MTDDTAYCPHCGAVTKVGASFCPSCGAQIAQSAPQQNVPPQYSAPPTGQPYTQNVKLESNLKTIGILTIVLSVIGVITALIFFLAMGSIDSIFDSVKVDTGDMTVEEAKKIYNIVFGACGAAMLILAICGIIASVCCMKKRNYGLGLAMYIIALVLNILTIGGGYIIGIVFAILLLIFYTKTKPVFES